MTNAIYELNKTRIYVWMKYNSVEHRTYKWNRFNVVTTVTYKWNKFNSVATTTYKWRRYNLSSTHNLKQTILSPIGSLGTGGDGAFSIENIGSDVEYFIPKFSTNWRSYYSDGTFRNTSNAIMGYDYETQANIGDHGWFVMPSWTYENQGFGHPHEFLRCTVHGNAKSSGSTIYGITGDYQGSSISYKTCSYTVETSYSQGSANGEVTSTNRSAYPNNGRSGNYWYVYDSSSVSYSKGSAAGTATSTNQSAYPSNGRHSDGYWYVSNGSTTSYSKGTANGSITSAQQNAYPADGRHTDGYWYTANGHDSTYSRGTKVGTVNNKTADAYPNDKRHTDGFWYVKLI